MQLCLSARKLIISSTVGFCPLHSLQRTCVEDYMTITAPPANKEDDPAEDRSEEAPKQRSGASDCQLSKKKRRKSIHPTLKRNRKKSTLALLLLPLTFTWPHLQSPPSSTGYGKYMVQFQHRKNPRKKPLLPRTAYYIASFTSK